MRAPSGHAPDAEGTLRRIALMNQKGGVGKTTTAANLGACLAARGKRVLLLDMDPQGNLSLHFGLRKVPPEKTLYRVLVGQAPLEAVVVPYGNDGIRIAPSSPHLSGAEIELAGEIGRETILRQALDGFIGAEAAPPDFVLVDCPPSLGLLTINALVAAEEIFVPLQTEFFALHGMAQLHDIVRMIQARINPRLGITGIVACRHDGRTNLGKEVWGEVEKFFPGRVFRTKIRENVKLAECPSHGKTILEYAPSSSGAQDYRALAGEILGVSEAAPVPAAAPPAPKPPPPAKAAKPPAPVKAAAPPSPAVPLAEKRPDGKAPRPAAVEAPSPLKAPPPPAAVPPASPKKSAPLVSAAAGRAAVPAASASLAKGGTVTATTNVSPTGTGNAQRRPPPDPRPSIAAAAASPAKSPPLGSEIPDPKPGIPPSDQPVPLRSFLRKKGPPAAPPPPGPASKSPADAETLREGKRP